MPSQVQCSKFRAPSTLQTTSSSRPRVGKTEPFPMCEMIEGIADGLAVTPLENVLGWQDQRLHLQQILWDMRIELHGPINIIFRECYGTDYENKALQFSV